MLMDTCIVCIHRVIKYYTPNVLYNVGNVGTPYQILIVVMLLRIWYMECAELDY